MKRMKRDACLSVYVDGASRGNPGPAGAGVMIVDEDGSTMAEESLYLGARTNNQAEYEALILGLTKVKAMNPHRVRVYSDSELLVKQVRGEFRVRNEGLKPLFRKAADLFYSIAGIEIVRIPRLKNKRADQLANLGIDRSTQSVSEG